MGQAGGFSGVAVQRPRNNFGSSRLPLGKFELGTTTVAADFCNGTAYRGKSRQNEHAPVAAGLCGGGGARGRIQAFFFGSSKGSVY